MRGKSYRKCLLLLVLVLCSPSSFSQPLAGDAPEIDPSWIYEISGAQLMQLQETLLMQQQQLTLLAQELQMSRNTLIAVQDELRISKKALSSLEESSMTLSELAQSAEAQARRWRIGTIAATSVGVVGWLLYFLTP